MSLKIFISGNVLVRDDSTKDRVFHYPLGTMWYSFDRVLKTFSVHLLNPESLIGNDLLFTDFQKENGDTFTSDDAVLTYLDELIAPINKDVASQLLGTSGRIKTEDNTIKELILGIEKLNIHLAILSDEGQLLNN